MQRTLNRRCAAIAAVACAMAAVAATPAIAHAQDPVPIGPGQYFSGYINGHPPGQAIIWTACFGPTTPGETGHPLANQTIEVETANIAGGAVDLGYTGTAANSIVATLGPSAASSAIIAKFTSYFVPQYIPTTITVPCAGSGVVSFTPVPGSPSAFSANLSVTFEPQP
jgi:hypothetical protein